MRRARNAAWGAYPRVLLACCCAAWLMCGGRVASGQAAAVPATLDRGAPSPTYFAIYPAFYEGEFAEALRGFRSEARGAIKFGPGGYWIDSICYQTLMGECYYQMCQYEQALQHYTNALQLVVEFSDWMARVQFDNVIQPAGPGQVRPVPWGASTRVFTVGRYSTTQLTAQGEIDQRGVLVRGGVVQAPVLYPVNVQEIVRCTCLAMRRWRELAGPVGPKDPLPARLTAALAQPHPHPNHWSEVYHDAQLGVAYTLQGKTAQAKTVLERAIVAAGEFDHPLTATVLFELGLIALQNGDFAAAETLFAETTYSAAMFFDPILLEEAFRYGYLTHVMGNRPAAYPPLEAAAAWANRERLRHLQASLLILSAENACLIGQPKLAEGYLSTAHNVAARRNMALGRIGTRLRFAASLVHYDQGRVLEGDAELAGALAMQQDRSLWLFHMQLVDNLWQNKSLSDRDAADLFATVLRDPTPLDWASDPLESISSQAIPHLTYFEHWFEVALARKEAEKALEIADLARRHRFLTTLDAGGRLLSLRWVLEAPEAALSQSALLQRQMLLARFPAYDQLAQRIRGLRTQLAALPPPGEAADADAQRGKLLANLAELSARQELLLRQISVRREACDTVFPPVRTARELQAALAPGQGLLVFFKTNRQLHAFLMSHDKYGLWKVGTPAGVQKQLLTLLRTLGQFGENKELSLADVTSEEWHKPARQLHDLLFKDARADLAALFDELIIVPDGALWYLPFECIQVPVAGEDKPLISVFRVRYAPTASLAVGDARPRRQMLTSGVVLGKLFPRAPAEAAQEAFVELSQSLAGAVALGHPLPAPSALFRTQLDQLIVLADVPAPDGSPYNWPPFAVDRIDPTATLASWFLLPWGAPECVLLPGFHTAAESSLKGQSAGVAGNDVFLPLCGLMSAGVRTILLSRWRTGGQTSFDLVREFAQELPHSPAAEAWQRSVLLSWDATLNPEAEPRLKAKPREEPPLARHPFFWAGYVLADTGAPAAPPDAAPVEPVLQEVPAAERPKPLPFPGAPADPPQAEGQPAAGDGNPDDAQGPDRAADEESPAAEHPPAAEDAPAGGMPPAAAEDPPPKKQPPRKSGGKKARTKNT